MGRFEGQVSLVTGAARGIGRAVTARLAAEGARVFAVDRDADLVRQTAAELSAGSRMVEAISGDVSQRCRAVSHNGSGRVGLDGNAGIESSGSGFRGIKDGGGKAKGGAGVQEIVAEAEAQRQLRLGNLQAKRDVINPDSAWSLNDEAEVDIV